MSKRTIYTEAELRETLDSMALEQVDDEPRLVWVNGRLLLCPTEAAKRFKTRSDQIARRAERLSARIDRLRLKIAAAGLGGTAGPAGI